MWFRDHLRHSVIVILIFKWKFMIFKKSDPHWVKRWSCLCLVNWILTLTCGIAFHFCMNCKWACHDRCHRRHLVITCRQWCHVDLSCSISQDVIWTYKTVLLYVLSRHLKSSYSLIKSKPVWLNHQFFWIWK